MVKTPNESDSEIKSNSFPSLANPMNNSKEPTCGNLEKESVEKTSETKRTRPGKKEPTCGNLEKESVEKTSETKRTRPGKKEIMNWASKVSKKSPPAEKKELSTAERRKMQVSQTKVVSVPIPRKKKTQLEFDPELVGEIEDYEEESYSSSEEEDGDWYHASH